MTTCVGRAEEFIRLNRTFEKISTCVGDTVKLVRKRNQKYIDEIITFFGLNM